MCNITVYVYCVYLYVISLCLHTKLRACGPAVDKFIFIAATRPLLLYCFVSSGSADFAFEHGCICESVSNTISLFLFLVEFVGWF